MATQICPNCKSDGFTWYVDDDITQWGCTACDYTARENESRQRVCSSCGRKEESYMADAVKTYWWCSGCNKITIVD